MKKLNGLGHFLILMVYIKFLEPCNNGTLITTSPLQNSTEATEIEDNILLDDPSLEELRIIFEIPKGECSCDLFNGYCPEKKKLN